MQQSCSLICTVRNESFSIKDLITSIFNQDLLPTEMIIVDGGSTDNTLHSIELFIHQGLPIKLIKRSQLNIAQGRNIAIQHAKFPIIACTDAGCTVHPEWLKEIMTVFTTKSEVKAIGGWYLPDAQNDFEKVVASLTFPRIPGTNKEKEQFLPSARNIAFYKTCWEEVGGFPEDLDTAEDTVFDLNLKKAGYQIHFLESAIVYWKVRPSLRKLYRQFHGYGRGDGKAGLFTGKYITTLAIYTLGILCLLLSVFNPIFLLIALIGFSAYIGTHIAIKSPLMNKKESFLIPLIILTVDYGRVLGFLRGRFLKGSGDRKI